MVGQSQKPPEPALPPWDDSFITNRELRLKYSTVINVRTNEGGVVTERFVLPNGKTWRRVSDPPPIFDNPSDNAIAMALGDASGDRLLGVFAQPGRYMCAKGVDPRWLNRMGGTGDGKRTTSSGTDVLETYAKNELAVEKDIEIADADSREVRELKQIVNGMREEMREYLLGLRTIPNPNE